MWNVFWQEAQMMTTISVNTLIYTLCHLPFIGPYISEEIYARNDIKKGLCVLSLFCKLLQEVFISAIILILLDIVPVSFIRDVFHGSISFKDHVIWCFLMLPCFANLCMSGSIVDYDDDDHLLIRQMRISPKNHAIAGFIMTTITKAVNTFLVLFFILVLSFHCSILSWLRIGLLYISFRLMGEGISLWKEIHYPTKADKMHPVQVMINVIIIVLAMGLAYGIIPLATLCSFTVPVSILYSWPVTLLCIAVAVVSVVYIMRCQDYQKVYQNLAIHYRITSSLTHTTDLSEEAENSMDDEVEQAEDNRSLFADKEGYEYMNALFFHRHKKIVQCPIRIKLFFIFGLLAGFFVVCLVMRMFQTPAEFTKVSNTIWDLFLRFFPISVFIMYCISSGKNITKAMFYNCDKSLLKYGYYHEPTAILTNFRIRLRHMIVLEFPIMVVLAVGLTLNFLVLGQWKHTAVLCAILAGVVILQIFYTVLYLCMYYIFQPYTEGGQETGVGYKVCTSIIYILSYSCLQLQDVNPISFSLAVLIIMVVMLAAAYLFAWKLAPKHFVLK